MDRFKYTGAGVKLVLTRTSDFFKVGVVWRLGGGWYGREVADRRVPAIERAACHVVVRRTSDVATRRSSKQINMISTNERQ